MILSEKVQVGKDQEKAQLEKDSHFKNRGELCSVARIYTMFICKNKHFFLFDLLQSLTSPDL